MSETRIDVRLRVLAEQIAKQKSLPRPVGGEAFQKGNRSGPDGTVKPIVHIPIKTPLCIAAMDRAGEVYEWFGHQGG